MSKKQIAAVTLDVLIVLLGITCVVTLVLLPDIPWRRPVFVLLAASVAALLLYERVCRTREKVSVKRRNPAISMLVLLGEADRPLQIWDLTGKVGLLIGKGMGESLVDVDLTGTAYETYIDPEHATLNYTDSGWWLQDTSSRNGVSIVRRGEELQVGHHAPARILPGDVICIARYTRIAVN